MLCDGLVFWFLQHIAKKVRELLDMDEPDWRTQYSKPTIGFLEWRTRTGGRTDGVAFEYSPYAKYMWSSSAILNYTTSLAQYDQDGSAARFIDEYIQASVLYVCARLIRLS